MAPAPITEDYYLLLEVEPTATTDQITKSYKRLAFKLHPDRNTKPDATAAFQLLVSAYETLSDQSLRRAYDRIYPSLKKERPSPQGTRTPNPSSASSSKPGSSQNTESPRSSNDSTRGAEVPTEAEQIARIKKVKKSRNARYTTQKCTLESSIYELHRAIRRLDSEIKKLNLTEAADREREKRKEWPGLAKATEEEKAQKERERQERRLGRDMKERRLASTKLDLEKKQALLDEAETENVAADLVDEEEIRALEARIEARERREKEERERLEKIMKQQQEQRERREREEGEARKKQQAEQQAAEEKRKAEEASRKAEEASRKAEEAKIKELEEELERLRKEMRDAEEKRQAEERASEQQTKADVPPSTEKAPSTCYHGSWWTKINEHAACPECNHVWHWLLECPNCKIQRCPPCKAEECGDYWYR